MQKYPHFNFMIVCAGLTYVDGLPSIIGLLDYIEHKAEASPPPAELQLAFGVALPDLESRFEVDFQVMTPERKQYKLGNRSVGMVGNELITKGRVPINMDFNEHGFYIFKAYIENEFVGQCVVRVIQKGYDDILLSEYLN